MGGMKTIQLTRSFLKRPLYSVGLLVGVVMLVEGLAWTSAYETKMSILARYGGFMQYASMFMRSLVIPEICTAYILIVLINKQHTLLSIDSISLTMKDIGRYELSLFPIILLSFFFFNPVTETVRFLLEKFPNYSISNYWSSYLNGTFTLEIYFRYLIPVVIVGYVAINISLVSDYFQQRQEAQEAAQAQAEKAMQAAQKMMAARTNSTALPLPVYLAHLKGKNAHGELDFPVDDVYYFTIEERYYYAELTKGRYLINKTLNELETELDPVRFFRIKRDYIVNRQAVVNYAYWENGKYIVRLNTPDRHEIVVPRARMQEFREWLQGSQQPFTDETATDSLILV